MVGHVGVPVVGRTVCFAFPSINQSRNPPVDDKTPSPTVMSVAALYRSLLGARLIAAPTPRRRHLARRETALHRRQNKREVAARPRQQKHQRLNFSFSSRLVSSCRRRTRARRAHVSPRSLREGRLEPGASRRSGGTRRQNARRSPHGDAAALAPPDIMLIFC